MLLPRLRKRMNASGYRKTTVRVASILGLPFLLAAPIAAAPSPQPNMATTDPWLLCKQEQDCFLVDADGRALNMTPIAHVWAPKSSYGYGEDFGYNSLYRNAMLLMFELPKGDYRDQRFGYIDARGKIIVPARYQEAGPFSEGRARVCDERGCGYIDTAGREIIPLRPEWKEIRDFHSGRALVRGPNWSVFIGESIGYRSMVAPWTVIDLDGKTLFGPDQAKLIRDRNRPKEARTHNVPPTDIWEITDDFAGGVAPAQKRDQSVGTTMGLIDTDGKIIAPFLYSRFSERNDLVMIAERMTPQDRGLLTASGQFISFRTLARGQADPDAWDDLKPANDGYSIIETGRWSFAIIDAQGRVTMKTGDEYADAGIQDNKVREGFLPVTRRLRRTVVHDCYETLFIDVKGKQAVSGTFGDAHGFSEGLAAARPLSPGRIEGKDCWQTQTPLGFIDHQGRWIVAPAFTDVVRHFRAGRAVVRDEDGVEMLIDRTGKVLARYTDFAVKRPTKSANNGAH